MYGPQPTQSHRSGVTFEANLGFGWTRLSDENASETYGGVGGISLGLGGWMNDKLAITARLAGTTFEREIGDFDIRCSNIFLGPSMQYWANPNVWVGGGLGLAIFYCTDGDESDSTNGFGLDLRAGYTFNPTSQNTFNVSFELNPGFYSENNSSGTGTGIGILLGYQHL